MNFSALFVMIGLIVFSTQMQGQYFTRQFEEAPKNADFLNDGNKNQAIDLPYVDSEKLYELQRLNEDNGEEYNYAFTHEVNLNLTAPQNKTTYEEGNKWSIQISSLGAEGLAFGFEDFYIPKGGKLYIYSPDKTIIQGPITSRLNNRTGEFHTSLVSRDDLILEYFEPKNVEKSGIIKINSVYHNFNKELDKQDLPMKSSTGEQANCLEGWCQEKRAVCKIAPPGFGYYLCTGTMVNNAEQDYTPYILTANHCFNHVNFPPKFPETKNYIFHYLYPNCTPTPISYQITYYGGTMVSNSPTSICTGETVGTSVVDVIGSDFYLIELNNYNPINAIDQLSGIHFAGWTRDYDADNPPNGATTLHHKGGGPMEYATVPSDAVETNTFTGCLVPTSPNCIVNNCDDGNAWWKVSYDPNNGGGTSPGSSGCSLMDENHKIIGQLYGTSGSQGHDRYSRFNRCWDVDPDDPSSNLKAHLDPNNTDLQEIDAASPTILYHNMTIAVMLGPDGLVDYLHTANNSMELAGYINNPNYDGMGHIPSNLQSFTVYPETNSEFKAGESICMLPGVTVDKGAVFLAHIAPISCEDGLDYNFYSTNGGSSKTNWQVDNDKQYRENLEFDVYPNPAKDNINIEFNLEKEDKIIVEISSLEGKTIERIMEKNLEKGKHQISWNTNLLHSGTYLCIIKSSKEVQTRKLVILN